MNNITRDHIHFAQVHVPAITDMHASDLLACKYVQLLIVKNESLLLQANCQPQPSTTVTRVVWYSAHPTHRAIHNRLNCNLACIAPFAIVELRIQNQPMVSNYYKGAQFWESFIFHKNCSRLGQAKARTTLIITEITVESHNYATTSPILPPAFVPRILTLHSFVSHISPPGPVTVT